MTIQADFKTTEDYYKEIKAELAFIQNQCFIQKNLASSNSLNGKTLIKFQGYMQDALNNIDTSILAASAAAIDTYAASVESVSGYTFSTEYDATKLLVQAVIDQITADVPTYNGYALIVTVIANRPVWRIFNNAQTTVYQSNLDAVINNIII